MRSGKSSFPGSLVWVSSVKMATTFDQELRKAFQELQGKMIETTQRMKLAEGQIMQLRRNITHARLTDQELASLPPETRTYESVGRMFVLQPVSYIRKELEEKLQSNEEKIKNIEANKEYLQRSVKEQEDNIREMLASRPK